MKKKINVYMMLLAGLAIMITLVLLTLVYYGNFRQQVIYDLRTTCHLLSDMYDASDDYIETAGDSAEELRVTLISPSGEVLYDSGADETAMENHLEREEVQEALSAGEGDAVRQSETMRHDTYYYAQLLPDGNVLRLSRVAVSLWSFFIEAVPMLVVSVAVLLVMSAVLAHLLTGRLVRPIAEMASNLENPGYISPYPEIAPFISTIRGQHQELKKTSELRQEFTANVSHELKTPLTSISGYAELMENGIIPADEVPHYAGQIRQSASRLITLINDIIQLSKLDSPVLEVIFEQVNLYAVAQKVVSSMQVNASAREVSLTLSGSDAMIIGNRGLLDELITNLCDNAIRYNYKGGSVKVSVIPLKGRVVLSVRDTGIGISKEDQERVFERFYRGDKSRSKETGGTGLGLSIVKHIVAQHKADIKMESELGKGTDIRVTFYSNAL